jgi:hypothetical protein
VTVDTDRNGLFYMTALGHGRRLAAHRWHGEHADPIQMMVGVVFLWVFLRVAWGLGLG